MFDKKRIVREAQAEIERLRGRLDDLRAENETNSYNARRALARADRAETALAAARKELSALRTGQRPPKPGACATRTAPWTSASPSSRPSTKPSTSTCPRPSRDLHRRPPHRRNRPLRRRRPPRRRHLPHPHPLLEGRRPVSLLDVLLPRPTGRRRKVLPTRTDLRRQIAELEELRYQDRIAREVAEQQAITYGHLFTAYDEQLRSEATARRATWANEHAHTIPMYADEDTLTLERPAVQPLWDSPMAVTR